MANITLKFTMNLMEENVLFNKFFIKEDLLLLQEVRCEYTYFYIVSSGVKKIFLFLRLHVITFNCSNEEIFYCAKEFGKRISSFFISTALI